MAVLVTAIHAVPLTHILKICGYGAAWMAVTSTAMTPLGCAEPHVSHRLGNAKGVAHASIRLMNHCRMRVQTSSLPT